MRRVLIADDHPIIRRGIRRILEDAGRFSVDEAASGHDVLERLRHRRPNVLVLDLGLPGIGGLELVRQVKATWPALPILILTVYAEDQFGVRALRAGASGYLVKDAEPEELVEAVDRVAHGRRFVRPSLAELLAEELDSRHDGARHERLSDREYEVLRRIARGQTLTEIARDLHLSIKTISTYRARLLSKLSVDNTSQLIAYALHHRLVEFPAAAGPA